MTDFRFAPAAALSFPTSSLSIGSFKFHPLPPKFHQPPPAPPPPDDPPPKPPNPPPPPPPQEPPPPHEPPPYQGPPIHIPPLRRERFDPPKPKKRRRRKPISGKNMKTAMIRSSTRFPKGAGELPDSGAGAVTPVSVSSVTFWSSAMTDATRCVMSSTAPL